MPAARQCRCACSALCHEASITGRMGECWQSHHPFHQRYGTICAMSLEERPANFYLGKKYDLEQRRLLDEPLLYEARDLTTHAVIVGMTGSGKTGLGIALL